MTEQQVQQSDSPSPMPALQVAPSPHLTVASRTTKWMMYDVIIALVPAVAMSFYVFGAAAGKVIGLCVASCMVAEAVFQAIRRRRISLHDGSAFVTGLILAMSLPWSAPWWIPVIGGAVAIIMAKMIFGGLGNNVFNPAMVGRAFLMICFAAQMAAGAFEQGIPPHVRTEVVTESGLHGTTQATPMTAAKIKVAVVHKRLILKEKTRSPLLNLFLGNVNGCLGETSALFLLLGGIYLCARRTAAWQIPAGVLIGAMILAVIQYVASRNPILTPLHHLFGGGLMLGAIFIATDPVTSPVSVRGRWVFGLGVGALTMVIRLFSSYPEGMMFAVLLMNAVTPMINRWTIPVPVGGKPAKPATA